VPNRLILALSQQQGLARFAMNDARLRPLVLRFVAGESLADALSVVQDLNALGLKASLDHLGENTTDRDGAVASAEAYVMAVRAIADEGLDANISVKLTAMGLDLGDSLAKQMLTKVLAHARDLDIFVRVDMESSRYTARTLELLDHVRAAGYLNTGPVIQAYLYRSAADVERLLAQGVRIRLCKGAYDEAPNVAFRRKHDTDRNFVLLMKRLLSDATYPAIATHDEAIIEQALAFTRQGGIAPERFEFQMLYGVRRDLQRRLVAEGFNVRIYVPYGTTWYPYLMRRLAERPANLAFMMGSLARDAR
jgi:proline dehydrogenase